jgi:hypothetical protein
MKPARRTADPPEGKWKGTDSGTECSRGTEHVTQAGSANDGRTIDG